MRAPLRFQIGLLSIASTALAQCSGAGGTAGVITPMPTPSASATPTPAPTPTPTPTPTPAALIVNPSSLSFSNTGNNCAPNGNSSCAKTFAASEDNYSGAFTATSNNTAVATVSPGTGSGVFTVTPVAAGTTTITVGDARGQQQSVSITVTATGLIIQARRMHGSRQ